MVQKFAADHIMGCLF